MPNVRLPAAAACAACLAASAPAAAGPLKPPDPVAPATAVAHERDGARTLLVTFGDAPHPRAALDRLAGLGEARPVVPEAGVYSVRADDPEGAHAAALGRPGVAAAEWSLPRGSDARSRPLAPLALEPVPPFTDPLFTPDGQWGLFGGPWGPDVTGQARRPRIAILDSGVDKGHEEWAVPGQLVASRSTVRDDPDAGDWSRTGHGTHVAGIAAAPANGLGVVGVAPARAATAQVMPVQIADPLGRSTDETMMRGIRWAVRHGARAINISAGGPGFSRAFQDTVLWATDRGAVIVASVGNEGDAENGINFPAAYDRVLGVGAQCDDRPSFDCPTPFEAANFSNHNRSVDVIAPGVNVLSSVPRRVSDRAVAPGYALKDGTSMAAPYVSGVVALTQASNGGTLSPHQVIRHLKNTAQDVGRRGRDARSGHGVVNTRAAVTLRAPPDDLAEVNDDIKYVGRHVRPASGRTRVLRASIERFEDTEDVYAVALRRGEVLRADLRHRRGSLDLYLWGPRTRTVKTDSAANLDNLIRFSGRPGRREVVAARATRAGRYYVNVFARSGGGDYTLRLRVGR